MLKMAFVFLFISLIAGMFGFTNVSRGAAGMSRILFFVAFGFFLLVVLVGLIFGNLLL